MLCTKLIALALICGPNSGGISDMLLFDPADFNFTQAEAGVDGSIPKYTAVALRTGATFEAGGKLFPVAFKRKEAEYTFKRAADNATYTHGIKAQLPGNSQEATNFLMALDAASNCCSIGIIFRTNDGKIWVAGEKYVNDSEIVFFEMAHADSDATSGKILSDFSGINLSLAGDYVRPLYEYSGTWDSIVALRDGTGGEE